MSSPSTTGKYDLKVQPDNSDDKRVREVLDTAMGFYPIQSGEIVNEHYQLFDIIGRGSFATVAKAYDMQSYKYVALKIIRKSASHTDQAQNEICTMQRVTAYEEESKEKTFFVPYLDHFMWDDYLFISMELYWGTLKEAMKFTGGKGIPLTAIRSIGYQLFRGLKVLGSPELIIIHGDLKPDNIMISDLDDWSIKIGDFGCAKIANEKHFSIVGNVRYRAPEITLELGFDRSVDIWSTGCILAEAFIGHVFFKSTSLINPFVSMVQLFGMPPKEMLDESSATNKYFKRKLDNTYEFHPFHQCNVSPIKLSDVLHIDVDKPTQHGEDHDMLLNFLDILHRIFVYDPTLRMTVEEAFEHKFITG